jgi:(5-formylfuran-3-yl)methyl phosphate synthase
MSKFAFLSKRPGLLVSVRNATEALVALAGGADVIDVKEPNRGSLGAADFETIADIVRAMDGRAPVSAAMGELVEIVDSQNGDVRAPLPDDVSLFKIGLANCASLNDWQTAWKHAIAAMARPSSIDQPQPVAVAYADWRAAQSPPPLEVLHGAMALHCPALLIDTWGKSSGSLFDHWPVDELRSFLTEVTSRGIAIVLAGSLTGQNIVKAAQLAPDLVAVRTAACDGGREGNVSERRVRELKNIIGSSTRDMAVV